MAICKVCGVSGAKFCMGCRRRYGGKTVQVVRTTPSPSRAKARRPRRASSPSKARRSAPKRKRSAPRGPKRLSRLAFLRRMRAGKLRKQRERARGGR